MLLTTFAHTGAELLSTGKIYEYLAARRPILAIVPEDGAAAELIRKQKAGVNVSPLDKERIKQEILELFKQFKADKLGSDQGPIDLSQFERKYLTCKLADFFDRVLRDGH